VTEALSAGVPVGDNANVESAGATSSAPNALAVGLDSAGFAGCAAVGSTRGAPSPARSQPVNDQPDSSTAVIAAALLNGR
jgi:hypothetical protein